MKLRGGALLTAVVAAVALTMSGCGSGSGSGAASSPNSASGSAASSGPTSGPASGPESSSGSVAGSGSTAGPEKTVRVGLISQVRIPATEAEYDAFKKAFIAGADVDAEHIEWVEQYAEGDSEKCPVIARSLASKDLDLIAGIGTPCIVAMAAVDKTTPIIALGIGDPVAAGVAKSLDAPGGNVTGSVRGVNAAGPLDAFLTITPAFSTVGLIYDQSNESIVAWAESLEKACADKGITLKKHGVTAVDQVGTVARSMVKDVDAVVLGPDGLMSGAVAVVAAEALGAKIPVYTSGLDTAPETLGIVADVGASNPELGEIGADAALQIVFQGKDAGSVPFKAGSQVEWRVNKKSAEEVGVTIPSDTLETAKILG